MADEETSQHSPGPAVRTAKTGRKGAARRQQVLDVARNILIEEGAAGLVLRDVAERVGITHGNVQYYFATKDDLLVAVFEQEVLRYTRSMHDAVALASTKEGRISAIIDSALTEIRSESTPLWLMLHSLARQSPELCNILMVANTRYDEALADELATVAPAFPPRRRRHLAQMIRMMLDGFAVQCLYDDPGDPAVIALQGEMKAAIGSWFAIEPIDAPD
jgi:AcrR family transcriptional regulator